MGDKKEVTENEKVRKNEDMREEGEEKDVTGQNEVE